MNPFFSRIADVASTIAGRSYTFVICIGIIVAWAVTGPIFKFSDTWQLIINTGTTIVTFLMVFLIQNAQNRSTAAMQVKLDEIILSLRGAQNRMIGIEHLTDRDLEKLVEESERRAAIPPEQRDPKTGAHRKPAAKPKGRAPARARAERAARKGPTE